MIKAIYLFFLNVFLMKSLENTGYFPLNFPLEPLSKNKTNLFFKSEIFSIGLEGVFKIKNY